MTDDSRSQPLRISILGCGYVGRAVGQRLLSRGLHVSGSSTSPESARQVKSLGIQPFVLKLDQPDRLHPFLKDADLVLVAVAPRGSQGDYRSVYLEAVRGFLASAALPDSAIRHIIYTSSTSVYGQQDGSWVDESSPTQPTSENAQILVQAERELLEGASQLGVAATVLRLAGIIGPGRGPANRLSAAAGKQRADGDGFVNLVHRDDIVEACARLLDTPFPGILNLSDGRPVRRRDYYDRLLAASHLPTIDWVACPNEPPDLGKRVSNRLAMEKLGLSFSDAALASVQVLQKPKQ